MPYCLLCGSSHTSFARRCPTCAIPVGRGYYYTKDLPEGWEACEIHLQSLQAIDEVYEQVRHVVQHCTAHSRAYTHVSPAFRHYIWHEPDNEPPPLLSQEGQVLHAQLQDLLRQEGWRDTITANGQPCGYQFWRRSKK